MSDKEVVLTVGDLKSIVSKIPSEKDGKELFSYDNNNGDRFPITSIDSVKGVIDFNIDSGEEMDKNAKDSRIKKVEPLKCCGNCSKISDLEVFDKIKCSDGVNVHEKLFFVTDLYHQVCDKHSD